MRIRRIVLLAIALAILLLMGKLDRGALRRAVGLAIATILAEFVLPSVVDVIDPDDLEAREEST